MPPKKTLSGRVPLSAAALALAAGALFLSQMSGPRPSAALPSIEASPPDGSLPQSLNLTAIVRDFRERSETGGHPDFELQPSGGFGHYVGMVADRLDDEGKPVAAGKGRKVTSQALNASGKPIIHAKPYIAQRPGDVPAVIAANHASPGAYTNAESFGQWWRDVPGTNISKMVPITLVRQPGTNVYTFNDRTDPRYESLGGFFPVNNDLYGNSRGELKNFHFTMELSTRFVYERGTGQVFTFTGDDDVYVFIDGRLVIDLGGVHGAISQTIELDRLEWLVDGETYALKFFFAERHRTQSNCRIDTTLTLLPARLPAVTPLYD